MQADPNVLDWITGIGQLIAVGGAIAAAWYAARSARAAERTVETQTRPLIIDVPQESFSGGEHRIVLATGKAVFSPRRGVIRSGQPGGGRLAVLAGAERRA